MNGRVAVAQAVKIASLITDPVGGRRHGPRVLIYHEIGGRSRKELDLPVASFEAQMRWVMAKGRVVGLQTAISGMAEHASSDLFVVTFDDGYRGVWSYAYPLLFDLGIPFTLYLTTKPIETQEPLFGDRENVPLTWTQVGTMIESGLVTIGAHTHSHPDMRRLSEAEVTDEVMTSDELIERRTGHRPRHFAYPWGYWSPQAHEVVSQRYLSAALGSGTPDKRGLYLGRFHRVPVLASDTPLLFRRRMYGGFRLEDRVRRLVKGYRGP